MIFRTISRTIALQFTAFVFGLLLITGMVFLAADYGTAQRRTNDRLLRTADAVLERIRNAEPPLLAALPPQLRERVRIVGSDGSQLYAGALFTDIPFVISRGIVHTNVGSDQFAMLTLTVMQNDEFRGYLQVAEMERGPAEELPGRALIFLLISAAVSAITFGVGIFFARSSLKPAEEMFVRLEQFTQDASHELRTPLAALSSSLDLALKTGEHKEGILSAKDDLKRVGALVERLLDLTRLDRFTLRAESTDLSSLAEEVAERFRPLAAERNVTIDTDITKNVTVRCDAGLIRQVIGNLLSNAIKFSKPEGGIVRIHANAKSLAVADNGVGIPGDALPNIFNRFYQADSSRSRGGFGLGLALVKRIVDLHGWTIAAQSKPGQGTTFIIRFS
jgi:signal transduction histidine kinase